MCFHRTLIHNQATSNFAICHFYFLVQFHHHMLSNTALVFHGILAEIIHFTHTCGLAGSDRI